MKYTGRTETVAEFDPINKFWLINGFKWFSSATDADVKLHNTKKIKKSAAAPARVDERYGESVDKRARSKRMSVKEARVFKRHNHFATKEKNKSRIRPKKSNSAKN